MKTLSLTLLILFAVDFGTTQTAWAQHYRASSQRSYHLDSGDILAIVVHEVLGDFSSAPIHWPTRGNDIIAGMGHPVPVRDDGTLSLPMIDPVNVRGMTVIEAEDAVERAYLQAGVLKGKNLVTASLMRKRTVQVMVVHDQTARSLPGAQPRAVTSVNLPADNATPLAALAESAAPFDESSVYMLTSPEVHTPHLMDGDVVDVHSGHAGFFFAGGLLNGGRYQLPRRSTLNAAQAIAQAGGAIGGPGFGPSEFVLIRGGHTRRFDTNWLLSNPWAVTIHPGDTIMLRQTQHDRLGNAGLDLIRLAPWFAR
ncbi:MAG: polysaccharide biosynthesis/export family protein [Pirellulaceae bacterium]